MTVLYDLEHTWSNVGVIFLYPSPVEHSSAVCNHVVSWRFAQCILTSEPLRDIHELHTASVLLLQVSFTNFLGISYSPRVVQHDP